MKMIVTGDGIQIDVKGLPKGEYDIIPIAEKKEPDCVYKEGDLLVGEMTGNIYAFNHCGPLYEPIVTKTSSGIIATKKIGNIFDFASCVKSCGKILEVPKDHVGVVLTKEEAVDVQGAMRLDGYHKSEANLYHKIRAALEGK